MSLAKLSLHRQFDLMSFAIQESFVALLPYFIISSIGTLFFHGFAFFNMESNVYFIEQGVNILRDIFPLLLVISIAYHIAKLHEIDCIIPILLAFTLFSTINIYQNKTIKLDYGTSFYTLLIPIFSTSLFVKLIHSNWLKPPKYTALGQNLTFICRCCPAFIICYIISIYLFFYLSSLSNELFADNYAITSTLSNDILMVFRLFFSSILFFLGIHGSNIFDLFINKYFLYENFFPNISRENFCNLFSYIGGAGCSLPLAIATLFTKDKHTKTIAKIALPFLIFNISEILVFGIPVIFNWRLLWPFIFLPILNVIIAYCAFNAGFITLISEHNLPWTTPTLISGYLASDGHFQAVLLQTLLIILDVCIYLPFVKNYTATQSTAKHLASLEETLKITLRTHAREAIQFQKAQSFIVKSHIETHNIIELITHNELMVFYQPKIKMLDNSCHQFEALIRLRLQDGTMMPPYFLETLEQAGLAPVIDLWVCGQVSRDLYEWQKENFYPHISVNLHPDTLQETESVQKIISELWGLNIEFEIIERTFLSGDHTKNNITLLQNSGFQMAIDDFGTGYSSLESLHNVNAQVIKIDKSLVDNVNTDRGYKIFCAACRLCKDLGFVLVIEGVETEEQMLIAKALGADYIQGWYYSTALPWSQLRAFSTSFSSSN